MLEAEPPMLKVGFALEGKSKMLVINAVRNKPITRIFSCMRDDRKYQENYTRKVAYVIESLGVVWNYTFISNHLAMLLVVADSKA